MSELQKAQIETALQNYVDPYLGKDLIAAKAIKNIALNSAEVKISVVLGFPASGYHDTLKTRLKECVQTVPGVNSVTVEITTNIVAHQVQRGVNAIPGVKNIIAVASGKGGVGKSTTAVNLALALSAEGAQVGILDADIYGPSQPRMLGVKNRPESHDGKTLEPVNSYGLQSMSIGYLIDEETPMIWRGPMVTQALEQLLKDTNWTNLDYLIVDLPPGTGDTQLTLAQKVPVSGAIIVTTPQDIALIDARKGLKMFEKVEVPVLGVVENMSIHICGRCGYEEPIFGEGGGKRMSEQHGVDFMGALPLDIHIREDADSGHPTVVSKPNSRIAEIYRDIARHATAKLSLQAKNYAAKFPSIVIQDT